MKDIEIRILNALESAYTNGINFPSKLTLGTREWNLLGQANFEFQHARIMKKHCNRTIKFYGLNVEYINKDTHLEIN